MRRGWLLVSLLSQSAAHQHGDRKAAFPLVARCLATAASKLSAGCLPADSGPAQPHHGPGVASGNRPCANGTSWHGFAAAAGGQPASTPGPSPAKLRAVPFTVTRQDAVREFEAYHSSNWLFKQPANGAQPPSPRQADTVTLYAWRTAAISARTWCVRGVNCYWLLHSFMRHRWSQGCRSCACVAGKVMAPCTDAAYQQG